MASRRPGRINPTPTPTGREARRQFTNRDSDPRCSVALALLAFGALMEFTALFLAATVVMLVAWRGPRPLALTLFAVTLIASVATYLHHATDALKLSF
jgi:hypothetical protein